MHKSFSASNCAHRVFRLIVSAWMAFAWSAMADVPQLSDPFTLAGATGVRVYPTQHLMITAEARAHLWRLKYPAAFFNPASDGSRVLPLSAAPTDWTLHPWFSLGIGWTF